jgi:hypothetical protein
MSQQHEPLPTDAHLTTQDNIFSEVYDLEPYEKTLKNARIWLYVISGLQLLMGIIEYNTIDEPEVGYIVLGIQSFIAVTFLVLALWSRKKPVPAFTIALVLYVLFNVLFMMMDTSNVFRGVIIKIFVVIALVKANRDARKYQEIKDSIGK